MTKLFLLLILILFPNFSDSTSAGASFSLSSVSHEPAESLLYDELKSSGIASMPSKDVFALAYQGYKALKNINRISRNILTIIDFSIKSTNKRLWVIDMDKKEIIFHELVAHGKNTGDNMASHFSNTPNSNMSSLGFYITGDTYTGKHGLSLYLDGQEAHYNSKARERAIVIHGADYVSESFVKNYGRLGRSFGCPALSMQSYKQVIDSISKGSCLFIYYPDETYLQKSTVLN